MASVSRTYIPAFNLPVIGQVEGGPVPRDNNTNTPWCRGIDKDPHVTDRSLGNKGMCDAFGWEGNEPPLKVHDHGVWRVLSDEFIPMEWGSKVIEGWQMGVAVCVYGSNMVEGTMDSLNIEKMSMTVQDVLIAETRSQRKELFLF